VRGFADEWDRGRKPSRGHLLWGAKTYKLRPKQFDLLLGDEPLSSACLAHLAVRTFISIHPDVDGRVHRALFWTSRFEPSIPSSAKTSRQRRVRARLSA
jgi:hypothetical protein